MACGAILACAQPKVNAWPLAFVALGGLFALWSRLRPMQAALHGAVAGVVYFAFVCTWIGDTAGPLLGPFGFILDLGPALIEMPAFAAAAFVIALIAQRGVSPPIAAVGTAAAFAFFEWLRGIGVMGAPLGQLGMPFVDTWFAAIAAFAGTFGITFMVGFPCALIVAHAARVRTIPRTPGAFETGTQQNVRTVGVVVIWLMLVSMANVMWPAKQAPLVHATTVAAVQGNIKQSVKWQGNTLAVAVTRYVGMTEALAPLHPALVVWPETVITTDLALPQNSGLRTDFAALARRLHTTLVVGAQSSIPNGAYFNALYFFDPAGAVEAIYRKRQLVPFAERLPADWLRGLPFTSLVSDFTRGTDATVVDAGGLRLAPSICWETGFGDLIHDQLVNGAGTLIVATDDAWFGTTAGPYQQAQIAQMRAIESGRWVVRAAATGISGIIAPTGAYERQSTLEERTSVVGTIGPPVPTLYARIGPTPVAVLLLVLMVLPFVVPRAPAAQ
jgi:apolipoprotein N-acyltransferase